MPTLTSRSTAPERVPTQSVRESLLADLENIEKYPTLSDTSIRAMSTMNSANSSSSDLASVIQRDGILAAAVLRLANNWKYRGRKEVSDIQQAVVRIGLKECGKLICTIGLRGMSQQHSPAIKKRCDALLRHSLFVAHLASNINSTSRLAFSGVEFTAGLLHDIGRIIGSVSAPLEFEKADPIDFNEGDDLLSREQEQLGIDHCSIGYNFAKLNKLPEELIRTILNHHRPAEERAQRDLVALVSVADRIANFAERERNIAGYDLLSCPFYPVLVQNWATQRRAALRQALPTIVVNALRETRQMLKAFNQK